MLKVRGLFLKLPGFSLGPIDLFVKKGGFLCIVGPTGSGKSLLLEAIAGLLPENLAVFKGKVLWGKSDFTLLPPEKRNFGLVYQDSGLFPHLSVKENILFGTRFRKIPQDTVKKRFNRVVERFKISPILEKFPAHLSGGERQRVALARVLILEPRLILLDEPLSALDSVFKREIAKLLYKLHRDLALTMLMVTHDFSEVRALAQKVAVMNKGRLVQTGTVKEIFESPKSQFIKRALNGCSDISPLKEN